MKRRGRLLTLAIALSLVALAGCQGEQKSSAPYIQRSQDCVDFSVPDLGFSVDEAGRPVDPQDPMIGYQSVQVDCPTQLVIPSDPPWSATPGLTYPSEQTFPLYDSNGKVAGEVPTRYLTDVYKVNWVEQPLPQLKKAEWHVIPAQVFQCLVGLPEYKCTGFIVSGIELTSYKEQAYNIGGSVAIPVESLQFTFEAESNRSEGKGMTLNLKTVSNPVFWTQDKTTQWVALLVAKMEWTLTGRGRPCFTPDHCLEESQIVLGVTTRMVISSDVGTWQTLLAPDGSFRQAVTHNPLAPFDPGTEPKISDHQLHQPPSIMRRTVDPSRGIAVEWQKEHSYLLKEQTEHKATIDFSILSADSKRVEELARGNKSASVASMAYLPTEESPIILQVRTIGDYGETHFTGFRLERVGK